MFEISEKSALEVKTLADTEDRLMSMAQLSHAQRRRLRSAIRSIGKLLKRPLSMIPADAQTLREDLRRCHSIQAGISRKRLANIKSELATVLQLLKVTESPRFADQPSTEWMSFLGQAPHNHQRWGLSRLARYCTYHGLQPTDVTDQTMIEFRDHLQEFLLTSDPEKIRLNTAINFNVVLKSAGVNRPHLSASKGSAYVTRPLSIYPHELQEDLERYIKRLQNPHLFDPDSLDRPLRPVTIRNINAHIRQVLDAAVTAGYSPDDFRSLADVISIEVVQAAFSEISRRLDCDVPPTLLNISATLLAIARHYANAPAETIRQLERAKAKISSRLETRYRGMAAKNIIRLQPFNDAGNVRRLVSLPHHLMSEARKSTGKKRAALTAMISAAIAILLACPMRMRNLAMLNVDRHLVFHSSQGRRLISIHIPPEEVKNRQPVAVDLGPDFSGIVETYIGMFRSALTSEPSDALFPSRLGTARPPDKLGELIQHRIWRETGLTMNPHLFRHFAATIFLQEHPGEYESVRRLVGHAKMDTTVKFYALVSNSAAFQRYHQVLHVTEKRRSRQGGYGGRGA
ncbi:MAG: tyrosine-type recombinase/integrase [Alphaproteobacteria bacterium]|nr:tyrosine-type recombinase/integrase [Alphaproteobacteria bacterium]